MGRTFYAQQAEDIIERIDRTTSVYMTEEWDGSTVAESLAALRVAAVDLRHTFATLIGCNTFASDAGNRSVEEALCTLADELEDRRRYWTEPLLDDIEDRKGAKARTSAAVFILTGEDEPTDAERTEARFGVKWEAGEEAWNSRI